MEEKEKTTTIRVSLETRDILKEVSERSLISVIDIVNEWAQTLQKRMNQIKQPRIMILTSLSYSDTSKKCYVVTYMDGLGFGTKDVSEGESKEVIEKVMKTKGEKA